MAKRMVTRTITETEFIGVVYSIHKKCTDDAKFALPGEYATEEKLLKAARKAFDTDGVHVVDVKDVEVKNNRYGMSEEVFLEYADILPEKSHKGDN